MRALRISCPALILLSALGFTFPVSAQQFDKTIYLGAGAAVSELKPRVNQSDYRVTESVGGGGQLLIGSDLAKFLSLEGYYRYLGESELTQGANSGSILYQTAGVNGLLYLFSSHGSQGLRNRTGLMLYGRAGVGYLENTSDDIEFQRIQSSHLSSGVGIEYGFNSGFALRAEFLNHDVDARDFSINVVKRFGRTGELDLTSKAEVAIVPEAPAEIVAPLTEPENTAAVIVPPPPPPPPPMPRLDGDKDGILDEFDRCEDTAAGALVNANGCAFSGILKGLTFASGSTALTTEATRVLDEVVVALTVNPNVIIAVESHTDNRGSAQSNMDLSRGRAESVVRYLVDVGGIDVARMKAVGYGESRPVLSNRTAVGRQANRRVEITVQ